MRVKFDFSTSKGFLLLFPEGAVSSRMYIFYILVKSQLAVAVWICIWLLYFDAWFYVSVSCARTTLSYYDLYQAGRYCSQYSFGPQALAILVFCATI